ncbi:acetyl-CoA synthetase-like protein [Camillea tinctor]|nr:acetyl-CoA synthetase-like protein [Camillea tinctor]
MEELIPHESLIHLIDSHVAARPAHAWLGYEKIGLNGEIELKTISYQGLSNAINGLSWFLYQNVARTVKFPTVAYLGPNDARYAIIVYASIKAQVKVFFPSPRNTTESTKDLLDSLDCHTIATATPVPLAAESLLSSVSVHQLQIPSLEELLDNSYPQFTYEKSWKQAQNEPFAILHTSGSTGGPKPVIYTNEFFSRQALANHLAPPDGSKLIDDLMRNRRFVALLPLFHMSGFYTVTLISLVNGSTPILPLPGAPPTSRTLHRMVMDHDAVWAAVAPSTIDCLANNPEALKDLSTALQLIIFLGGNPSNILADRVSRRIKLRSFMGSTEYGGYSHLLPVDEDSHPELWSYVRLHPCMNAVMYPRESGLYELAFRKSSECEAFQSVFLSFPHQHEYWTKDLFFPHPTIPDLWRHQGRADDILTFLNGEKIHPLPFESRIESHPDVSGVLMFGDKRFEAGLLVEYPETVNERHLAEALWPTIQEVNRLLPDYARIFKTNVIFTPQHLQPMLRTGKGTIRRQPTLTVFKKVIEKMYLENETIVRELPPRTVWDAGQIRQVIHNCLSTVTDRPSFSDEMDFFRSGLNSLQIVHLSRQLCTETGLTSIAPRLIYDNASVLLLTSAIEKLFDGSSLAYAEPTLRKTALVQSTLRHYQEMIEGLAEGPTVRNQDRKGPGDFKTRPISILLTGSTGYVGSYLLEQLIKHDRQPRVFCLNRGPDSISRQSHWIGERFARLLKSLPSGRVTFLEGDISSSPELGLEPKALHELLSNVDLIIHSAWQVDFNMGLSAFQPSLDGLLNLLKFSQNAKNTPAFVFLSSVAVAKNFTSNVVPEAVIDDPEQSNVGYGESKWIAEHLLEEASSRLGINTTIARVGQVSGPAHSEGQWTIRDWFPRLVLSSFHIRSIPSSLGLEGNIDWIPADTLAGVLVDICMNLEPKPQFKLLNVMNPNPVSWDVLSQTVLRVLSSYESTDPAIDIVPPEEWIARLQHSGEISDSRDDGSTLENSGLQLLEFFQERFVTKSAAYCPSWAMHNAISASVTLKGAEAIKPEWLERWTEQWLNEVYTSVNSD